MPSIMQILEGPITNADTAKPDEAALLVQMQIDLARLEKENDVLRLKARALVWSAGQAERKLRHLFPHYKGSSAREIFKTAEECAAAIKGMQFALKGKR